MAYGGRAYTAAHYYDPNKAAFQDFEPFWEFVSGPLHAGSFPQNQLDNTFGPQLVYVKAPSAPSHRRVTACNFSVTSRSTEQRNS
jgi:phosphodiesterase/alkaline phosphatase D-like protein